MNTWLGISPIDWAVIAVYLIGVTGIGIYSYKKVKDITDYFMGGRRFGKIFMMFFAFGAGTSSEQANAVVAGTWKVGLSGIWWQFLWLFATPFYWIIAPIMRRMRALTTSDFFQYRFNSSTSLLYSIMGIIMSITFIAGGLYAAGEMVVGLTGGELDRQAEVWDVRVPSLVSTPILEEGTEKVIGTETGFQMRPLEGREYAILAMTVMFIIYGMAGGLGAAIVTDFIQGILTITFSFLLLPFVISQIGGFSGFEGEAAATVETMRPGAFDLIVSEELGQQIARTLKATPITVFYVFMLSLSGLLGIVVQPHIMGVCGAGKTEYEGRFGFTFGNFLKRFCTIAWTFTGLACLVWYLHPDKSPLSAEELAAVTPNNPAFSLEASNSLADQLFGKAAYEILPTIMPGLIGLLFASLLAAVMSTSDAQMIVASGLFTENVYKRFINQTASQKHYVWVGRIAGLTIVTLAIILQATFEDVIGALKLIIKVPAAIGVSFWFGITWRKWTPAAVWISTIAGMISWASLAYLPTYFPAFFSEATYLHSFMTMNEATKLWKFQDAWIMFVYISSTMSVGLITSFLTKPVDSAKLDHFFKLLRTPVQLDEELEGPCTLPKDPAPMIPKLINHKDIEIPKPNFQDIAGFAAAWALVLGIIWFVYWLAPGTAL